mgnify:CR=1 FL=1
MMRVLWSKIASIGYYCQLGYHIAIVFVELKGIQGQDKQLDVISCLRRSRRRLNYQTDQPTGTVIESIHALTMVNINN